MKLLTLLLLLGAGCCRSAIPFQRARRKIPRWPDSYTVNYLFSLPYTATVQDDMVSYAVEFSRQGGDDVKVRMATLNATNVLIASKGQQYSVTPRLDRPMCHISKSMEEEDGIAHMQALPDVTGWELQEGVTLGGHQTNVWVYERRHQSKRVLYKFYAAPDGTPLRLHMLGNDIFSGAHYGALWWDLWCDQPCTQLVPNTRALASQHVYPIPSTTAARSTARNQPTVVLPLRLCPCLVGCTDHLLPCVCRRMGG